ncbi:hypothetical protein EWM64_g6872 [Hericium alpestre]|uniref:Cytochrome P450 n=1 Tax=Hericium alpestre TaxID=135208 RepID=A0A4Y9ZTJ0_9AGAM|nr:hypothetical protein EWM64_g6872 [Hericium alpestre]
MYRLIFGGIHQVAVSIVWVTFELADRPEYIPVLREEMYNLCGKYSVPKYAALRKAERLDSFIREVMRTKGDVLSVVREATQDTELSGYVVERGQLIFALGTHAHLNTSMQGFDAEQFDGMRWGRDGLARGHAIDALPYLWVGPLCVSRTHARYRRYVYLP